MPGTLIEIDQRFIDGHQSADDTIRRMSAFWSPLDVALNGQKSRIVDEVEAVDQLEHLLRDSVALRMEADVPLGAFLSGGIDSSTVVALMQAQSASPVRTFSIGFHEDGYNEAPFAKRVASHLGTEHTEFYVTPRDALDVIPQLPAMYDEPFSDCSQIPTYLVSKLARRHVTVCLSGDGGDELFGGYDRYFWARQVWSKIGVAPRATKHAIAKILRVAPGMLDRALEAATPVLPRRLRVKDPESKAETVVTVLSCRTFDDFYLHVLSHWKNAKDIVRGSGALPPLLDPSTARQFPNVLERMMYTDLLNYLPDDILAKVDRASMAVSLEARVPILDHRVVEFAWRLPVSLKVRDGQGKWILRQVLNKYVPKTITDRPKMGFGVPIDAWLRGPLREWAEDLLDEQRLKNEGYFEPGPVRQMLEGHLKERFNAHFYLWDVLMFQAWLAARKSAASLSSSNSQVIEPARTMQLAH
jgi:asparagine synthase (glutamine-hydrolysing)